METYPDEERGLCRGDSAKHERHNGTGKLEAVQTCA